MVAAFEVLIATNPVRNLIREGRSNQLLNVMFTNPKEGMQTMENSLAKLIVDGVITYEDAMSHHGAAQGTDPHPGADEAGPRSGVGKLTL